MKNITWQEFSYLVAGLGPETPLGRLVSIRSETDPERLKCFSTDQRRIRSEWLARQAHSKDKADVDRFLDEILAGFKSLSGGRNTASVEGQVI